MAPSSAQSLAMFHDLVTMLALHLSTPVEIFSANPTSGSFSSCDLEPLNMNTSHPLLSSFQEYS